MQRKYHALDERGALHPERVGRFTASSVKALFSKPTTLGYQEAIAKVAYERVTGVSPDTGFSGNHWTERGHELEDAAVNCYESETFTTVDDGGFWSCGEWYGASPDGLVGESGLFEGKAPKFTTHIRYLKDGKLPNDYKWQAVMQMFVTDRDWLDFQSYEPNLPAFRIRVERDNKLEQELIKQLGIATEQAEQLILTIKEQAA